jgi:hypothetical protein
LAGFVFYGNMDSINNGFVILSPDFWLSFSVFSLFHKN